MPFRPLPALTLYFEVADQGRLDQFLNYLTGDEFALSDLVHENHQGVMIHRGKQKLPIIELATEIAYTTIDDVFVLSTSFDFIRKVVDVHTNQARGLLQNEKVDTVLRNLPDKTNAFAYWDAQDGLDWLEDYKGYIAHMKSRFPEERWPEATLKATQRIRSANPGVRPNTPEFEALLDDALRRVEEDFVGNEKIRIEEWMQEKIEWLRVLGQGTSSLTFAGQDRIQLFLRAGFEFQD